MLFANLLMYNKLEIFSPGKNQMGIYVECLTVNIVLKQTILEIYGKTKIPNHL